MDIVAENIWAALPLGSLYPMPVETLSGFEYALPGFSGALAGD